jgi:hypothetical protein
VGQTLVFTVAVERPLHTELAGVRAAEACARRLVAAFAATGIPDPNRTCLMGQAATRAAVESRLKAFRKRLRPGDRAIVIWIGPGVSRTGVGSLDCWDTLPDDRAGTAFAIRDLAGILKSSKSAETILFLAAPGSDSNELATRFDNAPAIAVLSAEVNGPGETADSMRIWCEAIGEAIGGTIRAARDTEDRVTARSIQKFLAAELPRRLRIEFGDDTRLVPRLFGSAEGLLREAGPKTNGAMLDDARLRRIVYRAESASLVRDLSDYRKSHSVPAKAGPASRRFVQRLAARDVSDDLERIAARCRQRLGFKRKDLVLVTGSDGTGSLRTPEFEYSLSVELDPADSAKLLWRRELGRFADIEWVRSQRIESELELSFDQLAFELSRPLDVDSFIEQLENRPIPGVKIQADDDSYRLTLRGFVGEIAIRRNEIVVRDRSNRSNGLIDLLMEFLTRVGVPEPTAALLPAPGPAR